MAILLSHFSSLGDVRAVEIVDQRSVWISIDEVPSLFLGQRFKPSSPGIACSIKYKAHQTIGRRNPWGLL
jgi:hypothetical protein